MSVNNLRETKQVYHLAAPPKDNTLFAGKAKILTVSSVRVDFNSLEKFKEFYSQSVCKVIHYGFQTGEGQNRYQSKWKLSGKKTEKKPN